MRRRQGPTKKLAPANAPEHACVHTYREEEGLQIEIDCRECNGAHDLMNRKCLAGVMNALAAASAPEAIVLRRFTDKRYRGETVAFLASCSTELASINRLLTLRDSSSDRRCRTCHASKASVLATAKRTLLDDPVAYLSRRPEVRAELRDRMVASAGRCVDASQCVDEVLALIGLRPEVEASG
jgi:hypothetical protein